MSDKTALEIEIRDLGRYFAPPSGEPALRPGMTGQACANLRQALTLLGQDVPYSDVYDEGLMQAVKAFQSSQRHQHVDGHCGAGTARLVLRRLIESQKDGFFKRAGDPQQRGAGHAFFSYTRRDLDLVKRYQQLVEGWGFSVWRDQTSIPGGADWLNQIEAQISSAYIVLAFASRDFLKSAMCEGEVQHASALGKPILIVQLSSPPKGHWLGPVMQSRQWIASPPRDIRSAKASAFRGELRKAVFDAQQAWAHAA